MAENERNCQEVPVGNTLPYGAILGQLRKSTLHKHVGLSSLMQQVSGTIFGKVWILKAEKRLSELLWDASGTV